MVRPSPDRVELDDIVGHLMHDLTHASGKAEQPVYAGEREHTGMTAQQASMLIDVAKLPTTIAQVVVSFACRDWDRAAFLISKKTELSSIASGGRNLDPKVTGVVEVWKDSAFLTAYKSGQVFRGELDKREPHSAFVHSISKHIQWPQETMLIPLMVSGKALALLYADRKEARADEPERELIALCHHAAQRFVVLLAERKQDKPA